MGRAIYAYFNRYHCFLVKANHSRPQLHPWWQDVLLLASLSRISSVYPEAEQNPEVAHANVTGCLRTAQWAKAALHPSFCGYWEVPSGWGAVSHRCCHPYVDPAHGMFWSFFAA